MRLYGFKNRFKFNSEYMKLTSYLNIMDENVNVISETNINIIFVSGKIDPNLRINEAKMDTKTVAE